MIGSRVVDGLPALTLASAAAGGLEAVFVPGAGMVGCSLRHRGEELLGQRRGLRAYVADRATMGIPLLYPWANRVGHRHFEVAGREVTIDPERTPVRLDADGLPMHGLLSAAAGWQVERHEALADGALLGARFDFAAHAALMAAFPFAHELHFEAALAGARLTITTTVRASGEVRCRSPSAITPISGCPAWRARTGTSRSRSASSCAWTRRCSPPVSGWPRRSSRAVWAPGRSTMPSSRPPAPPPSCWPGGDRRIELAFLAGYPYAQVFAPSDDDVIAFEPMTAPTNALVDGGAELPVLAPGESYQARFAITLADGA